MAPTSDTVDFYFGEKIADPYRPLENDTAAETLAWVEQERALTEDYLSKIPFRGALRQRISDFNNYVKQGAPFLGADGRYYFFRNDGLKISPYFIAPTNPSEAKRKFSSILTL